MVTEFLSPEFPELNEKEVKKLIICPVYNEEKHLAKVLEDIFDEYREDLLIINDGSTDKTRNIIKEFGIKHIIEHKENLGYGVSLVDGFNYAVENQYNFVITIDGDGQHEAKYIKNIFKYLGENDLVFGSRFSTNSLIKTQIPKKRLEVNKLFGFLINYYTNFQILDAFCGFRGYRVEILKKLKLSEKGYGFPLEFWIQLYKHNQHVKIKELPISLKYLDFERNFNNEFKSDRDLFYYLISVLLKNLVNTGILKEGKTNGFYKLLYDEIAKSEYEILKDLVNILCIYPKATGLPKNMKSQIPNL